jgi:hypothetical protein
MVHTFFYKELLPPIYNKCGQFSITKMEKSSHLTQKKFLRPNIQITTGSFSMSMHRGFKPRPPTPFQETSSLQPERPDDVVL